MTLPIRRDVTVTCEAERAFEVFTREMDTWWPVESHSRAATELEGRDVRAERIEVQGRVGGEILEHLSNGETLPWAEVLAWEPPRRLVLAWRPHGRSQPPTEVEVTFTEVPGGTRVQLEHRGWERLTEDFRELYENYGGGWVVTLNRFSTAANDVA